MTDVDTTEATEPGGVGSTEPAMGNEDLDSALAVDPSATGDAAFKDAGAADLSDTDSAAVPAPDEEVKR